MVIIKRELSRLFFYIFYRKGSDMCGVFGVACPSESCGQALNCCISGIGDLLQRGPQGCGVAISPNENTINSHRGRGSIKKVFPEEIWDDLSSKLSGDVGISHTLYSTIGHKGQKKQPKSFQPMVENFYGSPFAVGYNGNVYDLSEQRKECKARGYQFKSEDSDTEVIVAQIATSSKKDFIDALMDVLPKLKGAFALAILYRGKIYGIRDRFGIRPLCIGGEGHIISSESCAFFTLGAELTREVQPGEIVVLGANGLEQSLRWIKKLPPRFCMFEWVYFGRPDSHFCGFSVRHYRHNAGIILAKESPVCVDLITPVPESGRIYDHAFGFKLGIPVEDGLFRNRHDDARTFLADRETDRRKMQRKKIHPLKEVIFNKDIGLVEDSLVRGSVIPETIAMCREAGAVQVHVRIGSAPIRYPCYYGIDMATEEELAAKGGLATKDICRKIFADSLGYLSIDGMVQACGIPKENLCLACFNGEYPVEPPKEKD